MKNRSRPSRPISFQDYQRISQVLKAVLDGVGAETSVACMFFAVAGAHIVENIHGVKAFPAAGTTEIRVNDKTGLALRYGQRSEDESSLSADLDSGQFHCWVHCGDYAIDFMAPYYQESAIYSGIPGKIERRMFQKPYSKMTDAGHELLNEGDFRLGFDNEISKTAVEKFLGRPDLVDLLMICSEWYRPTPKPMKSEFALMSNDGLFKRLTLPKLTLTGAW